MTRTKISHMQIAGKEMQNGNQSSTGYDCTPRISKARQRVIATKPHIDLERAQIRTESFKKTEGEPFVIRTAKAFLEHCQRRSLLIQEGELVVGTEGSVIRAGVFNPEASWQWLSDELETVSSRPFDPYNITDEQKTLHREVLEPYWKGKSLEEAWEARASEEMKHLDFGVITRSAHVVDVGASEYTADHGWLIEVGTKGIRKTIEHRLATLDMTIPGNYDRITYLKALLIACDGIDTIAKRYARLAKKMAGKEGDRRRKEELETIASVCQRVPKEPARTFHEALQALWFYQVALRMEAVGGTQNPGRMDQYLYPYYKKDLAEDRITREKAQELLECLWVKFGELILAFSERIATYAAGYSPFITASCGGVTDKGQDAVNDLSYMMVQAAIDVRLPQPSFSVRYNKAKNPDSFLRKFSELAALGTGYPAIHNDEIGIKNMLAQGISLTDAYNWNPCGCVELNIAGQISSWHNAGLFNLAIPIELALLNGEYRFPLMEHYLEPRTGEPENFETFGQFEAAVRTQLKYLIRVKVEETHMSWKIAEESTLLPVASLTFKECIESGKDYQCGGAKYNIGPVIVLVGVADLADSLVAVKKLIYDERRLTWASLLGALADGFDGWEDVRQMCLAAPKWGNDIREADDLSADIFSFIAHEIQQYTGPNGGRMSVGIYPTSANVALGQLVGALPSGRKAWTSLADGISPMPGADTQGPTAIVKSASRLDHTSYAGGTLLNIKFDPSLFADERGMNLFMSLVKAQCDLGVYELTPNVVSTEMLRDAQRNPDEYRGLIVRVAGYCAFFTELWSDVQEHIIERTVQKTWD